MLPPLSHRRTLMLVVACIATLALPAAASAKSTLAVGFLDNAYVGSDPGAFWNDAVTLHVGFMRWDMQWNEIAPKKPKNPRNPEDRL